MKSGLLCHATPLAGLRLFASARSVGQSLLFKGAMVPVEMLAAASGLRLVDDRAANLFPMPSEATGQDDVLVGRIRTDPGDPSGRTIALFIAGDQLRKGAALNAVQSTEALLSPAPLSAETEPATKVA